MFFWTFGRIIRWRESIVSIRKKSIRSTNDVVQYSVLNNKQLIRPTYQACEVSTTTLVRIEGSNSLSCPYTAGVHTYVVLYMYSCLVATGRAEKQFACSREHNANYQYQLTITSSLSYSNTNHRKCETITASGCEPGPALSRSPQSSHASLLLNFIHCNYICGLCMLFCLLLVLEQV